MDYTALTAPVAESDIDAYRAQARADGYPKYNTAAGILGGLLVSLIFLGIIVAILVTNTVPAIVRLGTEGFSAFTVLSAFTLLFAVAMSVLLIWILRLVAQGGKTWENWLRLTRFAQANRLQFSHRSPAPSYPGVIFTQGHSQHSLNHVRSSEGRFFDVGSFQYITGSGRNRATHNWGFLALKLDRVLPHMLLDATANNTIFGSNLPLLYRKEQILPLEGDFNEHFTLYCPKEYERDALYVFTPDLMALLIDEAAPFDVEIVEDWLFVYSKRPLGADESVWSRMFGIIDTVGAKTLDQTHRYADQRVGDPAANIVAPQGKRLRTRISVLAVIAVLGFIAIQIARVVLN